MSSVKVFRPFVLYCHGLGASPNNHFAQRLQRLVESRKVNFHSIQYKHIGANKLWDVNEWLKDILICVDNAKSSGFSSSILIGFSGGCHGVLRAAIKRPDDVSGLLLLAPGVGLNVKSYVAVAMPQLAHQLFEGKTVLFPAMKDGIPVLVNRKCLQDYAEKCVSNSMSKIPISCPVRIILGDSDKVVPVHYVDSFIEKLKSSDVQKAVLPGVGHFIPMVDDIAKMFDSLLIAASKHHKNLIHC